MFTRFVRSAVVLSVLVGVSSDLACAGDNRSPEVPGQATSESASVAQSVCGPQLPGYLAISNAMRALTRVGLEWDERLGLVARHLDPFEYFKGVDVSELPLVEPTEDERRKVIEETFGREFAEIADDVAAGRKHPAHVRFRWDAEAGRVVTDWDPYRHDGEVADGKRKPIELTELQRRHIVEQTFGPEFLRLADAVAAGSVHPRQVRFQWDRAQQHAVVVLEPQEDDSVVQLAVELPDRRTVILDPSSPEDACFIESVLGSGDLAGYVVKLPNDEAKQGASDRPMELAVRLSDGRLVTLDPSSPEDARYLEYVFGPTGLPQTPETERTSEVDLVQK